MSTSLPVGVVSVGSLLRARTVDTQGNELGTFTEDTRPTATQVLEFIAIALDDLASLVGSEIPEKFWGRAANVATYRAAMLIELSFFPEQVAAGRSPYEQIRLLYLDALKALQSSLHEAGVDVPGEAASLPEAPSFSFPLASSMDHVLGIVPGGYTVPLDQIRALDGVWQYLYGLYDDDTILRYG